NDCAFHLAGVTDVNRTQFDPKRRRHRLDSAEHADLGSDGGDRFIEKLVIPHPKARSKTPDSIGFVRSYLRGVFHTLDPVSSRSRSGQVPKSPRLCKGMTSGLFAIVSWHARPREETKVPGQPRGPATELRMTPGTNHRRR